MIHQTLMGVSTGCGREAIVGRGVVAGVVWVVDHGRWIALCSQCVWWAGAFFFFQLAIIIIGATRTTFVICFYVRFGFFIYFFDLLCFFFNSIFRWISFFVLSHRVPSLRHPCLVRSVFALGSAEKWMAVTVKPYKLGCFTPTCRPLHYSFDSAFMHICARVCTSARPVLQRSVSHLSCCYPLPRPSTPPSTAV